MGPKPGQKLTDNPKDFLLQVRIDQETKKDLDQCAEELGLNRSKIVRMGIQMVKESIKK